MMKNLSFFLCIFLWNATFLYSQTVTPGKLPASIDSGYRGKFHVQSAAVDQKNGHVYFSFTDKLVKTDLEGNLIGSVTGIVGHLGDIHFDAESGKVYASLEYKDDSIGRGISQTLGKEVVSRNGFYVAVFEGEKITEPEMNAEEVDLLKTIYLKEVVEDYLAEVKMGDEMIRHRHACSGIDGITIGPDIGKPDGKKKYLYVAYGVYGDTTRMDNDHQVILKYDIKKWDRYGGRLTQDNLHESGPRKPKEKYFVRTGNTRYGIQNLAYDSHSGNFYAAVYRGAKSQFPNYDLFVIDGFQKPVRGKVYSDGKMIRVKTLSLVKDGLHDADSGSRGWYFKWGTTGLEPLGKGLFYISHNRATEKGQATTLYKYRWTGDEEMPFERVD